MDFRTKAAVKVGESLAFFWSTFFSPKKNRNFKPSREKEREKNVSVGSFAGGLSFYVVVVASSKKFQH